VPHFDFRLTALAAAAGFFGVFVSGCLVWFAWGVVLWIFKGSRG